MTDSLRKRLDRRLAALKTERDGGGWLAHWRELSDHLLPRRGRFTLADRNKGDRRNSKIIDNTATLALRTLSSGMMAGITSPARPWFRLATPDDDLMEFGPVKAWLHLVEQRMRLVFARSNLYNVLPIIYEELGAFGTGAMIEVEDFDQVVRFYPFTAGEYCLANSERLSVNTLYREFSLTVAQVVERFGLDAVSARARSAWQGGRYDEWIDVVHVIEPNADRVPGLEDARGKPYRSVYYEIGAESADATLRVSGFDDFPVFAPRWHVMGTDVYGRSPGMDALGDIKQLQVQQKRKAQAIDKLVSPPLVGSGNLKQAGGANVLPGATNYVDGLDPAKQLAPVYQVAPQVQHLVIDIEDTRRRIDKSFHADLFLMVSQLDDVRSATEILQRKEEKMLLLGPVLERVFDELLEPMVDRTFNLMLRAGVLPEPPAELSEQELRVEFVSVLAEAQKAIAVGGIERFAGFAGNLAAVYPGAADKIDADQILDEYAAATGVPPAVVRSDDDVAALRQARAEAEAQKQAQAQAMATAQQVVDGAATLSKADMRGDNALTRLAGAVA